MSSAAPLTLFSVVIPARDEEESLPSTIADIVSTFSAAQIPHELEAAYALWQELEQLQQTAKG